MEVLLWLWLYNSTFLFNIKSTLQFFKNIWILPIVTHIFVCFVTLYYLHLSAKYKCDESFRIWQTLKFFLSFLFMALLFVFKYVISSFESEMKTHLQKISKIQDNIKRSIDNCGTIIKRKTLTSPFGMLILFFGGIYFFGSFFIVVIYTYDNKNICDDKLKNILKYHSMFVLITNAPLIVSCVVLLFTKGCIGVISLCSETAGNKIRNACCGCWNKPRKDYKKLIKDYKE